MSGIEQGVGFPITAVDVFSGAFDRLKGKLTDAHAGFNKLNGVLATLGTTFTLGGFAAFIKHTIDAHDATYKLSQKLGIAVGELSQYNYALGLSDVSHESFEKGVKSLSQRLVESTDATSKASRLFTLLGVNTRAGVTPAIEQIANTFARLPDGATKAALAVELFGKTGMDMIPFLNQGADGIRKLKEEAVRLGLVMDEETAKAAERFNDNMKGLTATSQRLGIALVNESAPSLERIAAAMKEAAVEGGFLNAIWVGMGGSLAELIGLNDKWDAAKQIRSAQKEVVRLRELVNSTKPKDLGDGIFDRSQVIAYALALADAEGKLRLLMSLQDSASGKFDDQLSRRLRQGKVLVGSSGPGEGAIAAALGDSGKVSFFQREMAEAAKAISVARAELANGTDHLTISEKKLLEVHQDPEWKKVLPRNQALIDSRYQQAIALERAARALAFYNAENTKEVEASGQRGDALKEMVNSLEEEADALMLEASLYGLSNKEREKAVLLARMEGDLLAARGNASAIRDITANYARMFQAIDMRSFNESQMTEWDRLHEKMAVVRDDAQTIGDIFAQSFGRAGQALAGATKGLADFAARQAQINEATTKKLFAAWDAGDFSGYTRAIEEANEANTRSSFKMYGDMAGAAKGFFKEHSAGYQAMEAVEKAFRAVELAMALKSFLTKTGFLEGELIVKTTTTAGAEAVDIAATAASIGRSMLKAGASMVAGVAKAFEQMGVYGFIGAAAIIGFMASIGLRSGSGGGGSAPSAQDQQRVQGTGSVLGDVGAKSESIARALNIIRDNTSDELTFSSAMLTSLRNIESAMAGVASLIARSLGIGLGNDTSRFNLGTTSNQPSGGGLTRFTFADREPISHFIFGSTTRSLQDSGIQIGQQSVGTAREGFNARQYANIETHRSGLAAIFGGSGGVTPEYDKLDPGINRQFTLIIDNMVGAVRHAAEILGANGADVERLLNSMNISLQNISFKDLKGDEIQKALEAVFGKIGDDMAALAMPAVVPFQRVGEGMFETLIRVASGVERARAALDHFGVAAIDWTDIVNKQGDVAVEIIRQSLDATETINGTLTGVGQIIAAFDGSADDLITLYQKMLDIRALIRATNGDPTALNAAMITAAGGLSAFQHALEAYNENFFTEGERIEAKQRELASSFSRLGIAMPTSIEGFRALVESIDTSTEAGQRFYGAVIALAPAFADTANAFRNSVRSMYDAAANLSSAFGRQYSEASVRQAAQNWLDVSGGGAKGWNVDMVLREIGGLINGGTSNNPGGFADALRFVESLGPAAVQSFNALLNSYRSWQTSMDQTSGSLPAFTGGISDLGNAAQDAAEQLEHAKQGVRDYLDSLLINDQLSPLSPMERLGTARTQFEQLLTAARGGDATAMGQLSGASDAYLRIAREIFASGSGYVNIFKQVTGELGGVSGYNGVSAWTTALTSALPQGSPIASQADIAALSRSVLAALGGVAAANDASVQGQTAALQSAQSEPGRR
jgi:hypothetical protein